MDAGEVIVTASSEAFFGGVVHERARRFLDPDRLLSGMPPRD
jgi:polar amino acid transport system ATP-binding protein